MPWKTIEETPDGAPEHSIPVLVYHPEYGVRRGQFTRYYADKGIWPWTMDDFSPFASKGVTHWMPIPKPPEEE